jgi:hypothetical protein
MSIDADPTIRKEIATFRADVEAMELPPPVLIWLMWYVQRLQNAIPSPSIPCSFVPSPLMDCLAIFFTEIFHETDNVRKDIVVVSSKSTSVNQVFMMSRENWYPMSSL